MGGGGRLRPCVFVHITLKVDFYNSENLFLMREVQRYGK